MNVFSLSEKFWVWWSHVKLHFLITALFSNGMVCVEGLWKGLSEEVMIFSSGVSLYLNVNSAAALVFDEGELGNH